MVNKNIQMKKKEGNEWDNLFPITLFENIFNNEGINLSDSFGKIEDDLEAFESDLSNRFIQTDEKIVDSLTESKEYTDEKISNIRMIAEYDVDPTGANDSLQGFIQALEDLGDHETLLLQPNATYFLSESLIIEKSGGLSIDGNGSTFVTNTNESGESAIVFKGKVKTNIIMSSVNGNVVTVNTTAGIEAGDLLYFQSNEQFNNQRAYYKKGGVFVVSAVINPTQIVMSSTFPYEISQSIITVYDPITVDIRNFSLINNYEPSRYIMGLDIQHAVDSNLQNIYSSGFDICIHIREHYQTSLSQVSTGRAYFEGASQAYGLASYISNNFMIMNSRFVSGRHGLEISGFETSFNTLILNTDVANEAGTSLGTSAFNQHQSSYGILAINSQFESVGLTGRSVLYNCTIYGDEQTRLAVGNNFGATDFVFENCIFPKSHVMMVSQGGTSSGESGQPISPAPKKIGGLTIKNCRTDTQLRIVTSNTIDAHVQSIKIENTDMVTISDLYVNTIINKVVYVDCNFPQPFSLFTQRAEGGSYIKEMYFVRCKFRVGYNSFLLRKFDLVVFDSCTQDNPTGEPVRWTFESSNKGELKLVNTDFSLVNLNTPGDRIDKLLLIGSQLTYNASASNIPNKQETTLRNITI